jgi:hypothetical protein
VEEPKVVPENISISETKSFSKLTWNLLCLSIAGFILQILTVFHPTFRFLMLYPAASWVMAFLLIAIQRPVTAPKLLLVLYVSIIVTQCIVIVDGTVYRSQHDIPTVLAIITALVAIVVVLIMPLRDPLHPSNEISAPFTEPTSELRSPEDNMTLWQFMTVSWMAPLINAGNARQLNDEDVWSLGYEFKHRILHDRFRELKGSVLTRLIEANGIDLFIMSVLAVIELIASRFLGTPL